MIAAWLGTAVLITGASAPPSPTRSWFSPAKRYATQMRIDRVTLPGDHECAVSAGDAMSLQNCSNCGAPLTGPYCAACGQHAHESARTVGALFHDAVHVITHADSRFWRTLYTLLLRPGRLTQEYFAERRARYLPPVRVYLVLSLLFFALSPFGPHNARQTEATPSKQAENSVAGESVRAPTRPAMFNVEFSDCDKIESSFKWLEAPLRQACRRNVASGGAPVRAAFIANIPKMMFVFLPLIALVMLLLYWRPRHLYVEHLVFFLHTHAAMFLILLLLRPLDWAVTALPALRGTGKFLNLAAGVFAVWYVFRAMRVYYGQRRWLTFTKFVVVSVMYAIFLTITLVTTLIISALTA
jgi:hypothetical protein